MNHVFSFNCVGKMIAAKEFARFSNQIFVRGLIVHKKNEIFVTENHGPILNETIVNLALGFQFAWRSQNKLNYQRRKYGIR